ncbi:MULTISPECIES: ABC transporter substrate-binding protein [unclassified Microbacterium]|uniref:ABC transporter substrate-binding protein n=1 Tax=unclassified Microbacterium TaxID=2609290 RepID=UPI0012FBC031|nr:extracellular solute-binding protein [Microbacterium sp. MAH-37]
MTFQRVRRVAGFGAAALVVGLVATGCSGAGAEPDAAPTLDPDAKVTIRVGDMPTEASAANLEAFKKRVAEFEELHPNITVKGEETRFDVSTFNALLVGGTLPTTLVVPRTNIQQLLQNEQVKDLTAFVKDDELLAQQNPVLTEPAQDEEGNTYGIATNAYTMGLVYNRDLYAQAGLDPDAPPTTWDEVRENAIAISKSTGKTGFIIPTTNNGGGWVTTALTYAFGGTMEDVKGDEVTVTADNEGTEQALTFLQGLRWDDDAAGATFLLKYADVLDGLGAGGIGQTVIGADQYNTLVVSRGMDPDDVGIAPIPQEEDGLGALGGGSIAIVNPKATDNETAAAIEWNKFLYLNRYVDEDAAVAYAKANQADDLPVGVPEVPLFDEKRYEEYLGWIEPYLNVPREHFTQYLDSLNTLPIVTEPAVGAQSIYGAIDAVVQQVLTEKGTDIGAALTNASATAQSAIDAAQ